jgi:hypothetical protein
MAKKELTVEQKGKIIELFKDRPEIEFITQQVFNDQYLDGRSWQGKLVAKFLVEKSMKYKTAQDFKRHNREIKELTDDDKAYIISAVQNGDSLLDVARVVYKDDNLKKLSSEWRKVQAYCTTHDITSLNEGDEVALGVFYAPKEIIRLVNIVNEAIGTNIKADNISGKYKAYFDKLRINLDNSRLRRIVSAYETKKDRDLFIDEFVRLTFEKPDLTPDELNLYLQIIRDTVSLEGLESKINKLNSMFLDMEDANDLNQRFSENLKACVDEKNQVTARIAATTKKLQGDRSERLKNKGDGETSFLAVVQLAQDEQERKNMLRLAELQRATITEEANKLESMDDFKCRILGVSKEDVV